MLWAVIVGHGVIHGEDHLIQSWSWLGLDLIRVRSDYYDLLCFGVFYHFDNRLPNVNLI